MSIRKLPNVILSGAKNLCGHPKYEILRRWVYPEPAEGLLRMTSWNMVSRWTLTSKNHQTISDFLPLSSRTFHVLWIVQKDLPARHNYTLFIEISVKTAWQGGVALYNVQNLNRRPKICMSCWAKGGMTTAFVLGKRNWWAQQTAANSPVGFFWNRVGEAMRRPCLRSEKRRQARKAAKVRLNVNHQVWRNFCFRFFVFSGSSRERNRSPLTAHRLPHSLNKWTKTN